MYVNKIIISIGLVRYIFFSSLLRGAESHKGDVEEEKAVKTLATLL